MKRLFLPMPLRSVRAVLLILASMFCSACGSDGHSAAQGPSIDRPDPSFLPRTAATQASWVHPMGIQGPRPRGIELRAESRGVRRSSIASETKARIRSCWTRAIFPTERSFSPQKAARRTWTSCINSDIRRRYSETTSSQAARKGWLQSWRRLLVR